MKRYSIIRLNPGLVFLLFLFSPLLMAADLPIIAAASSVKFALQEIAYNFKQDTGKDIRVSYSSSGNLTRLIQQGAPFELFLSANSHYIDQLYHQQKTLAQGKIYALGRLVLISNKNTSSPIDGQLTGIKKMLQTGQLKKFAIANPTHAPYGVAAQEVLQQLKLWGLVKPHLVLGENAAQTAQFASSGAVQAGLISYSLALSPALQKSTHSVLIPANLHQPIQQSMVLLNNAGDTSKLFFLYLQQDKARTILSRYGYSSPEE